MTCHCRPIHEASLSAVQIAARAIRVTRLQSGATPIVEAFYRGYVDACASILATITDVPHTDWMTRIRDEATR
jgi:hypothetical protein